MAGETYNFHLRSFTAGAIAACGSVTFTNPWEVVKTRLQLQGELQSKSQLKPKTYGNAFSTFGSIFKNEGISGLQRGLMPAYIYQILLNGFRLGMYDPIKNGFQLGMDAATGETGSFPVVSMVASGATAGIVGAAIASPFFLIKTRMQAYTKGSQISVGHQHSYVEKGIFHSLKTIFKAEGIKGLWRGADASMMRTGIGSSVQLPSYDLIKTQLLKTSYFQDSESEMKLHFSASLITSLFVCISMNPFDVVMTRMYNQKDGGTYNSAMHCMAKTLKNEGPSALYKGFAAHYLRIGPHTILTFVFLEQARKLLL
jgi:solute carrier family 25 protein 34/35